MLTPFAGLVVDRERSVVRCTPSRRQFRVYANSDRVRFVALFADYNASELRKPRADAQPVAVRPTDRSVDQVVMQAHAESQQPGEKRRLDVLLLHSEPPSKKGQQSVGVDARFFIDHFRLNRKNASKINCDLWHLDQLFIDAVAHTDTPPHRLATRAERRHVDAALLPLLLIDDPMRRWHGFLIDDVVAVDLDDADTGRQLRLLRVAERAGPATPPIR